MLEQYLIAHCSPTLASLKTASLFTYAHSGSTALDQQLKTWNARLAQKGIECLVLRKNERTALIYVCRKRQLQSDLKKPGVARFLQHYGYTDSDADRALRRLTTRLKESDSFPHEIGIFLGYPLWDVIGFIRNAGKNSKCTGCWKVYCNECDAIKTFAKFKKCTEAYTRLWLQGKSVLQLTVA